jgi:hypothetical protein
MSLETKSRDWDFQDARSFSKGCGNTIRKGLAKFKKAKARQIKHRIEREALRIERNSLN